MRNWQYILSNDNEGSLTLTHAPIGWDDIQYTFTRSEIYWGIFKGFAAKLQFVFEGRDYIQTIYENYPIDEEILLTINRFSNLTRAYVQYATAIIDLSTYKLVDIGQGRFAIEVNIRDNSFQQILKVRDTIEIPYNRLETLDGETIIAYTDETETITVQGNAADSTATAIYSFECVERLIESITGYRCLLSSVLDRTGRGAVINGEAGLLLFTKGMYLRGWTNSDTNISFNFQELFKNINNAYNLGLGFEVDGSDTYVRIENKSYFFQGDIITTIESSQISELEYEVNRDQYFNEIITGYSQFLKDNDLGLSEYNTKAYYSTLIKSISNSLDLTISYRADGTAVEDCRVNYEKVGTDTTESEYDEQIFMIDCVDDSGIKSREQDGFDSVTGVYGASPIYMNLNISPARNLTRWGDIIRIGLQKYSDALVAAKFNKSEKLSSLDTLKTGELAHVIENEDIDIYQLNTPIFTGNIVRFSAPVNQDVIDAIDSNPNGIIKYWDYKLKEYKYGWIKEVSTHPIDKKTNWELWESTSIEAVSNFIILESSTSGNTDYFLLETGDKLLKEAS